MIRIFNFIERFWLSLTYLALALITIASLFPADQLPVVPGSDKTHHFVSYCLLMLPTVIRKPKRWLLIALLFILWSGLIELIQPYVNRYGEWFDMLANAGGVLLAIMIGQFIHWLIAKQKIRKT